MFFFETEFQFVVQTGLELTIHPKLAPKWWSPAVASQVLELLRCTTVLGSQVQSAELKRARNTCHGVGLECC